MFFHGQSLVETYLVDRAVAFYQSLATLVAYLFIENTT